MLRSFGSSFVFSMIFLCLVVSPHFKLVSFELSVVAAPLALASLFVFLFLNSVHGRIVIFLSLWLVAVLYVLVVYVLSGARDDEMLIRIGKMIFIYLAAFFIVHFFSKDERNYEVFENRIFWLLAISLLLQALAMWLSYITPEVERVLSLFIRREELDSRVGGLQALGRDSVSLNQSIGALVLFFLLCSSRPPLKIGVVFLILSSGVLAGRTGIVAFIVCLVFYYLAVIGRDLLAIKSLALAKKAMFLAALFPFCLISLLYLSDYAEEASSTISDYNDPVVRMLEPFRKGGDVRSVEKLKNDMMFVPDSAGHFLFGDGFYGRKAEVYVSSDIGYVRQIFGMGLVGLGSFIGIFIYMSFSVFSMNLPFERKMAFCSVVLFGVIGHMKIVYLPSSAYFFLLCLMYFILHKHSYFNDKNRDY